MSSRGQIKRERLSFDTILFYQSFSFDTILFYQSFQSYFYCKIVKRQNSVATPRQENHDKQNEYHYCQIRLHPLLESS